MDDRELLELAAKAAGYRIGRIRELPHRCVVLVDEAGNPVNPGWNPLDDDGDALRLMAKLDLLVAVFAEAQFMRPHTEVSRAGVDISQPHDGDKLAATRRAIVRAAAEIGRAMP